MIAHIEFTPDTEETPVVFRKSRRKSEAHEITAVFPCEPADYNGYQMACYAHVGQHGGCGLAWYNQTRAAKPEEYADLKQELESAPYGYRLKVYSRIQPWMRDARAEAVRKIKAKPSFYRCGICECFHSINWNGDCRQDDARFAADQLDERYGSFGWEEVEMPV